ncbi:UDP-N-acetylmuramate dehydrogenase [Cytophagaceae bacterium ABcell3]|nr:UDP-N-acetylmuramate dehydrogenase [Cytophagaceae bacterium ABcell3]
MNIEKKYSLHELNTFGIEAYADFYTTFHSVEQLKEIIGSPIYKDNNKLILGGGSNVLFTQDFKGLVLKNNIKGIAINKEEGDKVILTAGAGEIWHNLVLYCVEKGYGGIENLSLIPGTVGASPMQNIGAYGVEIKDIFESLKAVDALTGETKEFTPEECCFGYRNSIFKKEFKGRYIITHVSLRLSKNPLINVSYGAISDTLKAMNIANPTIKDVSNAIIHIRQSKLPDPKEIGNAGSFFKNPEIPLVQFQQLKKQFHDIVSYPVSPSLVKVPAGWLIEKCGWKGKTFGNIGVHKKQALVLVNYGGGKGIDIVQLSKDIQASVKEKFNINLEPEVNII